MKQRMISLKAAGACLLATGVCALSAPGALAATLPTADFRPGHTMGVGLAGLSYDYGFSGVSLGASVASANYNNLSNPQIRLGTRAMVRFLQQQDLSAAVVGGVVFDPGYVGGRSYLVPDLGIGVGYRFTLWNLPLALRFNVTLTAEQGQNNPYYGPQPMPTDPNMVPPRGNFLQRLAIGPNTMVGLAYMPSENLEVTVGAGTLIGVRFTY